MRNCILVAKQCEDCKIIMHTVYSNRRFCVACAKARDKRRKQSQPNKQTQELTDICKLAAAEGLSYGKYVLKHGL